MCETSFAEFGRGWSVIRGMFGGLGGVRGEGRGCECVGLMRRR